MRSPRSATARQLAAGRGVGDVDQLVARPVAVDHACRDLAAEVVLEALLRPEDQATHVRVQSVGADDQVEIARRALLEGEPDTVAVLVDGGDAVPEDRFDLVFDRGVDGGGQVAAGQAGQVVAEHAAKDLDVDVGLDLAGGADGAKVLDLIPGGADRVLDAHALGHLVADAPEVDHVAAGAEFRRLLDHRRGVAGSVQPVGERRSCHAGTADRYLHTAIVPYVMIQTSGEAQRRAGTSARRSGHHVRAQFGPGSRGRARRHPARRIPSSHLAFRDRSRSAVVVSEPLLEYVLNVARKVITPAAHNYAGLDRRQSSP